MNAKTMDEVNRLWAAFERYKETAQQHEFVRLLILDRQLIPRYEDLKAHYNEEHAQIFKRVMRNVLKSLGVILVECDTCANYLGGGCCRINLEAECSAGDYEAWEAKPDGGHDQQEQDDTDHSQPDQLRQR